MFKTVRWRERESTSLLKQEKSSVPRLGGKEETKLEQTLLKRGG